MYTGFATIATVFLFITNKPNHHDKQRILYSHAFKNIGKKTANLVVIFPANIWKYDVLDYFPFKSDTAKTVSRFSAFKKSLAKK